MSTGGGTEGEQPPVTLPLVPVPVGCTAPPLPHIVFVGKVVDRDFRSVRFEIEQIRAGQAAPFASGNEIDVRYGLDAQYLARRRALSGVGAGRSRPRSARVAGDAGGRRTSAATR